MSITVNLRPFFVFVDRQQIWQVKKKIGMFLKKIEMFSGKDRNVFGKRSKCFLKEIEMFFERDQDVFLLKLTLMGG